MAKRQPPPGITTQAWEATPNRVQALVYMLLAVVEKMQQIVPQLQKQIEQQQKRISQLEEQAGKNSRNSSKPPSSDPPHVKKSPPKARGKRPRGRQPGHKGHGRKLKPPEEVTRIVVSKPSQCQECETLLLGTGPHPRRHQVCELPPVEPEIIEYQAHTLTCLCYGYKNRAPWPAEMPTGSFGPRVQGLIGYLSGRLRNGDLLTWAINRKERGGRKENKSKNFAFLVSFAVKNAQLICLSFLSKRPTLS